MRETYIKISGYQLLDVIECTIHQCINKHALARISGHIADSNEEPFMRKALTEEAATIIGVDEKGNEFILFDGIIGQASIGNKNGSKLLTMELFSRSYNMDITEKIKSFQNVLVTYDEVVNEIMSSYTLPVGLISKNGSSTIDSFLVQYNETDWEFLKRVASRLGMYVFPDAVSAETKISIGTSYTGNAMELTSLEYKIVREKNNTYYIVKSRDYHVLGELVSFLGQQYVVVQVDSILDGAEMYHTYIIKQEQSLNREEYFNSKIIGVSLEAYIDDVKEDKVRVRIDQDAFFGSAIWFPYATIYSSPDGTGWYCMPEVDDRVRVYFPNATESEAYVMSSVHVGDNGSSDARSDPNVKSIKSKYGKEIKFTENSLKITNTEGMYIEMTDNEGIVICSDKGIKFEAEGSINFTSITGAIEAIAMSSVTIKQGNSKIDLSEGKVIIDGGEVKTV